MKIYIATEGRAGSTLLYQYLKQIGIETEKMSWGRLYEKGMHAKELLPARFIHLMRRDRINQAVSRIKHLLHNQQHISSDEMMSEYLDKEKAIEDIPVPKQDILKRITMNVRGDTAWELFFERHDVDVLTLFFEDLIRHRDATLQAICEMLDTVFDESLLYDKLQSTHTHINDKWVNEILKEAMQYL